MSSVVSADLRDIKRFGSLGFSLITASSCHRLQKIGADIASDVAPIKA